MLCPKCQHTLDSQTESCLHCEAEKSYTNKDEIRLEDDFSKAEPTYATSKDEQTISSAADVNENLTSSDKKISYYLFSLLIGLGSGLVVWLISFLLSLTSSNTLINKLWTLISAQFINLSMAKTILIENQIQSNIWYIANAFLGSYITGSYSSADSTLTHFSVHFPLLIITFLMIVIAFAAKKMITSFFKKQSLTSIWARLLASSIYILTTWIVIAVPLLVFQPKYKLPFTEATETLHVHFALEQSFLFGIIIITIGLILGSISYKHLKLPLFSSLALILLCLIRDFIFEFISSSSVKLTQFLSIHESGLDSLWLNRFIYKAFTFLSFNTTGPTYIFDYLFLQEKTYFNNLTIMVGLTIIIIAIISAKLEWKAFIKLTVLALSSLAALPYFSAISIVQTSSINEHNLHAFYYNEPNLIGYIIILSCALTIFMASKLCYLLYFSKQHKHSTILKQIWAKRNLLAALLLLTVFIISTLLMFNAEYKETKVAKANESTEYYATEWAKQLYLMQNGPREYALINAKQLWTEQGTNESKALLAISYLQSYQTSRGQALLKESSTHKNKLFTKEELNTLMQWTDISSPTSMLNQGILVASTINTEVDEDWHVTMDEVVWPKIDELLEKTASEKLTKLLDVQAREITQSIQLDTDYIDFVKILDEEKLAEIRTTYEEAIALINEKITYYEQLLREHDHREDSDNINVTDEQSSENSLDEIIYYIDKHKQFLVTLAKAAMYYGDTRQAEKILALIVTEKPDDEEAALLLSSIYLNGQQASSEIMLTSEQYEVVTTIPSDALKEKHETLLEDYTITSEADLNEFIDSSYITENTSAELALEVLKPFEDATIPEIDYQLAKYYYQTDQSELAEAQIEKLYTNLKQLDSSQQQVVNQLIALPQDTSDMTIDERQLKHELTEQLYYQMEPLKDKSFQYNRQLTNEEQAFSVFLSNTLLSFKKSTVQIKSLQYNDGSVTLFLQSDNINLNASKLKLTDNNTEIKQFEFTKLSETSSFERYVMLILDSSGSMEGEKVEVAKQSAINFINDLKHEERVGVIAFNDAPMLNLPFTTNKVQMSNTLSAISAESGTRIAPALNLAIDKLQYEPGERIAFILSDGEDGEFSDAKIRQSIIQEANRAGITIYAVGFDAGYQTLRDVAEGTGGYYIAATDFESLSQGFAKISETLSQTYRIKYDVDAKDYGLHTATIVQESFEDNKRYTIEDPNSPSTHEGSGVYEYSEDEFNIKSFTPNKIVISKKGKTKVTVEGTKLKDVKSITLLNTEVDFNVQSQNKLTFSVPNNHAIGSFDIVFKSKNNETKKVKLTFTDAKVQQSMPFGYATLYGDQITTKNGSVEIIGNPSIDHFIYPQSNTMKLNGDEVLSYSGLSLLTNKATQKLFDSDMEMSISDFGTNFDIESQGFYNKTMNKLPGLDTFGISLRLARSINYEANLNNDDGTLKLAGGMEGFDKLQQLNQNLKFKVNTRNGLLEFLPTNATLEQEYDKEGYTLSADFGLNIGLPVLAFDSVSAGFKYESPDKRIVLKGQAGGFELFRMQSSNNSIGSVAVEVGINFTNGLDRMGAELESTNPVPLATTGLGVNKLGFTADWSKKNEGALTLGLTTMSDVALNRILNTINSVPIVNRIFNIDSGICLVCMTGTLGFKELGSANVSLNGSVNAELLGLQLAEANATATLNHIDVKTSVNVLVFSLDQTQSIVFKDKLFNNYTTLKYMAEIDAPGINPHTFAVVLVPQRADASYLELSKVKKGKTITIQRIGNKLNMIKS